MCCWSCVADDVPSEVKSRRLAELFAAYRQGQAELNALEVGRVHLALIDGRPRRDGRHRASESLQGRTDSMKRVIIPECSLPVSISSLKQHLNMPLQSSGTNLEQLMTAGCLGPVASTVVGDLVAVRVQQVVGHSTLLCDPIAKTSVGEFAGVFGSCTPGTQHVPAWLQLLLPTEQSRVS